MEDVTDVETLVVAAGLIIARQLCEVIAKNIPDSATGFMGGVRKLFRALALHVTNKE